MNIFIRTDNVLYPGSTKMKKNMVCVLYKFIDYGEKTEKKKVAMTILKTIMKWMRSTAFSSIKF